MPAQGWQTSLGGGRLLMRVHTDLILGRAEIVAVDGRQCRVRIFSGRTPGTFRWLAVSDVRLELIGVGAEGRLVIRTDRPNNDIRFFLLPD
jgi:hypothetical protein